jgi:SAM-dependent methyltransferase
MQKEIFPPDSLFLTEDPRKNRWAIPYNHLCLNARVHNLLVRQIDRIEGKRILDLASHIGTFSFAALELGANEVVGVEMEEDLIKKAQELFRHYEVDPSRYRFEQADVMDYLEGELDSFDTVFCFGILYYVADPYRLLELMAQAARETILLDTFTAAYAAVQGKEAGWLRDNMKESSFDLPLMVYILTRPKKQGYMLPKQFHQRQKNLVLQGLPTQTLIETFFDSLEMGYHRLDWTEHIQRPVHWQELISQEAKEASHWADVYSAGIRASYRLSTGKG